MSPTKRKKPAKSFQEAYKEHSTKFGAFVIISSDKDADEVQMGTPYTWDEKQKELVVFTENLSDSDKIFLQNEIKLSHSAGDTIEKTTTKETHQSYTEYAQTNDIDRQILTFFRPIIDNDDYEALKMSLYLRKQQELGKNIAKYKSDIRAKFGDRGANIANLCSAKYFEDEFMMMYNDVDRESFDEYYEIAVGKKARALFVHSNMGEAEIEREFDNMVSKAQKYHLSDFRVHGLGAENVGNIKAFLRNRSPIEDEGFKIRKDLESKTPPAIEYSVIFGN